MDLPARVATDAEMLKYLGIGVDPAVLNGTAQGPLLYLDVVPRMVNALEFCHGGILYSLADTACAYALGQAGFSPATVDASVTYLRPGRLGERLTAQTQILRSTARQGSCDVRVLNPANELVLVYRGTCANTNYRASQAS